MEDLIYWFGEGTLGGASAAGYCANVIDFEQDKEKLGSLTPLKVIFTATAAVTGFAPALYTGSTNTPTTEHVLGSGISLAVDQSVEFPLPFFECERYMRAGGKGTGKVIARIVVGTSSV